MPEYLLTLANNNPNGANWGHGVRLRTNTGRTIVAQVILAMNANGFNPPGVRIHVRPWHNLMPGETYDGIAGAIAAPQGQNFFWPVTLVTRLDQ